LPGLSAGLSWLGFFRRIHCLVPSKVHSDVGFRSIMVTSSNYIIFVLILLVLVPVLYQLLLQRKTGKRISEVEKRIADLGEKYDSLTNAKNALANKVVTLQKAADYLQKVLEEKVKGLNQMFASLEDKTNTLFSHREELKTKINGHVHSLNASLEEVKTQLTKFQESAKKMIGENGENLRGIANHLNHFSDQIQKMKDHIRERNVDLEL
jgi:chromosome segregation ATPase